MQSRLRTGIYTAGIGLMGCTAPPRPSPATTPAPIQPAAHVPEPELEFRVDPQPLPAGQAPFYAAHAGYGRSTSITIHGVDSSEDELGLFGDRGSLWGVELPRLDERIPARFAHGRHYLLAGPLGETRATVEDTWFDIPVYHHQAELFVELAPARPMSGLVIAFLPEHAPSNLEMSDVVHLPATDPAYQAAQRELLDKLEADLDGDPEEVQGQHFEIYRAVLREGQLFAYSSLSVPRVSPIESSVGPDDDGGCSLMWEIYEDDGQFAVTDERGHVLRWISIDSSFDACAHESQPSLAIVADLDDDGLDDWLGSEFCDGVRKYVWIRQGPGDRWSSTDLGLGQY